MAHQVFRAGTGKTSARMTQSVMSGSHEHAPAGNMTPFSLSLLHDRFPTNLETQKKEIEEKKEENTGKEKQRDNSMAKHRMIIREKTGRSFSSRLLPQGYIWQRERSLRRERKVGELSRGGEWVRGAPGEAECVVLVLWWLHCLSARGTALDTTTLWDREMYVWGICYCLWWHGVAVSGLDEARG